MTLSVLIARGQTAEMPFHFRFALDNGVKPAEISEMIAHLAFYAGWPNVFSAMPVFKDVFSRRAA
ncbi:carboxymuconolactone decarboxylase family protein [Burkholderia ubonensis]|uniref:carboxymuconolactone decarboxylase family protein n=1 Tax=Burkholderia ubonensis TaxID=101571 RepID=UPI000AA2DC2D